MSLVNDVLYKDGNLPDNVKKAGTWVALAKEWLMKG